MKKKEGAALLGQKEGIPVVPAYPDGALNQIGSGALEQGIMSFSVGTSTAIRITAQKNFFRRLQASGANLCFRLTSWEAQRRERVTARTGLNKNSFRKERHIKK